MTSGTDSAAQQYIDEMFRQRGYALRYHSLLAAADFPVLEAANNLISRTYLDDRGLDRQTKELLFIVSLVVLRASPDHIKSHIRVALELGVSEREVLEAIEISLPEAGVVAFQEGFYAWCDVVGTEGLRPSEVAAPAEP